MLNVGRYNEHVVAPRRSSFDFFGRCPRQIEGETHKQDKIASAGTERQTKLQILPDVNGLLATTKEGLVFSYCR